MKKKECSNCGHTFGLMDIILCPKLDYHICSGCGNRHKTSYVTCLVFISIIIVNFVILDGTTELLGFIFLYILCWPFLNLMFGFRKWSSILTFNIMKVKHIKNLWMISKVFYLSWILMILLWMNSSIIWWTSCL